VQNCSVYQPDWRVCVCVGMHIVQRWNCWVQRSSKSRDQWIAGCEDSKRQTCTRYAMAKPFAPWINNPIVYIFKIHLLVEFCYYIPRDVCWHRVLCEVRTEYLYVMLGFTWRLSIKAITYQPATHFLCIQDRQVTYNST